MSEDEGSASFLKKRSKKLLLWGPKQGCGSWPTPVQRVEQKFFFGFFV
jgi:hypothetical protein